MTSEVWHIVIVDDSPDDRAEVRRLLLKGSDCRYAFAEAETGAAGISALGQWATARQRCIVLDYNLPDMAAPAFLAAIGGSDGAPDWPVVVCTGGDSAETGRRTLRAGAHDYVGKNGLTPQLLVRAVENAAERWAMARELRQQTAAAQASAQRFEALAQATSDIVYRMSADWSLMSPMDGRALVASTDAPIEGWAWLAMNVPADEQARVMQAIDAAIAQKALFSLEHRVLRPDGSIGWTSSRAVPIFDAHGHVLEWFGAASDITERKQEQERLRLAIAGANLGTWHWDIGTGGLDWSERCLEIFGLPPRTAMRYEKFLGALHPEDRARADDAVRTALQDGSEYRVELRCVWPDGSEHWAVSLGRAHYDAAGEPTRMEGIALDITQRKLAEAALRETEQNYQALAEASAEVAYRMSADWSTMLLLDGGGVFASSPSPLADWAWVDQYLPRDEQARVMQTISDAIARKTLFELEHRVLRANGSTGWVRSRAVPIVDLNGSLVTWFGAAGDITARKDAELALARSEAFARSVVGASADCMKGLTLDGRLLWMNDLGQRLMEVGDFAALHGTDWGAIWEAGGMRAQAEAAMATARAGGTGRFAGFCPTFAGTPRWWDVAVTSVLGQDGRAEQLLAVSRDVTGQRAADQATEALAKRLQMALEGSAVVLFQQDLELRYTWIHNPALGFEIEQVVGKRDIDLMERAAEAEVIVAFKREVLLSGVGQRREAIIHHLGVAHHYRLLVEPLRDAAGVITGVTCAAIDITELKQTEQALLDRDQQKDEFLATLAHELRNPLAPIKTGLELLARVGHEAPARGRLLGMMDRQLDTIVRLIDDLMDVSRITGGKLQLQRESVDLRDVAQLAVEECQPQLERAGHRLTLLLPPSPMPVLGDAMRLVQAVSNLLSNASKYTNPGGSITLTVSGDGGSSDAAGPNGTARIAVQDNGMGIAAEMLESVFDMFTQVDRTLDRAQGGMGIGLALVRNLMRLHGGDVRAVSAGPGMGSCFTLELPQLARAEPRVLPAPVQADSAARALKVLVVDDNVDAARTLAMLLELDAHEVRIEHAGDKALLAAEVYRPDVVFCDLGLPGLAGADVAKALRRQSHFARTLLVAVSGWGSPVDRVRSRDAGFDAHLTKPVSREAIAAVLRGGLAPAGGSDAG